MNQVYRYRGELSKLLKGVKTACEKMSLIVKEENVSEHSFSITAANEMRWLSSTWPIKFSIEAELVDESYVLLVQGGSFMSSTAAQSANNQVKIQEFLSLIKLYAPMSASSSEDVASDLKHPVLQSAPVTINGQPNGNLLQAIVGLVVFIGFSWYFFGGGLTKSVAQDFEKQYDIAVKNGSSIEACVHAGLVAETYLQAHDESKYKHWTKIKSIHCDR